MPAVISRVCLIAAYTMVSVATVIKLLSDT
jgi:hypothetical protein